LGLRWLPVAPGKSPIGKKPKASFFAARGSRKAAGEKRSCDSEAVGLPGVGSANYEAPLVGVGGLERTKQDEDLTKKTAFKQPLAILKTKRRYRPDSRQRSKNRPSCWWWANGRFIGGPQKQVVVSSVGSLGVIERLVVTGEDRCGHRALWLSTSGKAE